MIGSRFEKNKVLTFEERVDPASSALVVIDVQNDFALPQGACGKVGDDISPVAPMVERLSGLIEAARKAKVLIVFVRTVYDEPVLSPSLAEQYTRRGYPNSICLSNTPGVEFFGGIGPRNAPNEILVTKHRYSAFWGSSLDLVLRNNGIRTAVFTGIATEVCVESTARDAFFKDYQVVVPSDCVGCYSESRQAASLAVIARSFGVVTTAQDIEKVWSRPSNTLRNWEPEAVKARALETLAAKLDPAHTALLLLKVAPGKFEGREEPQTLPNIINLLNKAREAKCLVIHAHATSAQARGNDQVTSAPGLEPRVEEQIVFCHRASAFADTALEVLLRSNCIRTLVVAGAATDREVESTVREAADKDYHVVVAEDCVAAPVTDLHAASLKAMGRHFGAVVPSQNITANWSV